MQATNLLAVVESDHRLSFLKGLRFDTVTAAAAATTPATTTTTTTTTT